MFKIVEFDYLISDDEWDLLKFYLRKKDNKIYGLDFSNSNLRSYFKKFLEVMRSENLYLYFDLIEFGKTTISTRKLIKLANFCLSHYSEEAIPFPSSMLEYVFM